MAQAAVGTPAREPAWRWRKRDWGKGRPGALSGPQTCWPVERVERVAEFCGRGELLEFRGGTWCS